MSPLVKTLAAIGVFAVVFAIFAAFEAIKTFEDGGATGSDHRTEEEREKDASI